MLRRLFLIAFVGGTVAFHAHALQLDRPLRRFQRRIFSVEQGLPHVTVQAMTQTTDGYMWFGTIKGLARFDGVNCTVFDKSNSSLSEDYIFDVAPGRSGDLWIAHQSLSHYANGKFTTWDKKELGDGVWQVRSDRDGSVWALGRSLLIHFDGRRFQRWNVKKEMNVADTARLAIDRRGNIWISTLSDGVVVFDRHHFTKVIAEGEGNWNPVVPDADGGVWIATHRGVVHRTPDGRMNKTDLNGVPQLVDRHGSLWLLNDGLVRVSNGQKSVLTRADGIADDTVKGVVEDREGNIWIATMYAGVVALIDSPFATYTMRDGLGANAVMSITQDRNERIWVATADGAGFVGDDDRIHALPEPLNRGAVNVAFAAPDGTIWFGAEQGVFAFRDGRITHAAKEDAAIAMAICPQTGQLWVANFGHGIAVIDHDREIRRITRHDGLANDIVRSITALSDGSLLVGTGDGTQIVRNGQLGAMARHRVLSGASQDAAGTIWGAMQFDGIARIRNGVWSLFGPAQGVTTQPLWLVDDGIGSLWAASLRGGFFRYSKRDLDAIASGAMTHTKGRVFGSEDGLGSRFSTFWSSTMIRAHDGSLWVATSGGLSHGWPSQLRAPEQPTPMIESMAADNVADNGIAPRFASGMQRLAIRFAAPSFIAPERTTFEYKLEPFDERWNDAGARRLVEYTKLPPGHYRILVRAKNGDEQGANVAERTFVIAPSLVETLWFRIAVSCAVALLVTGAYVVRVRRMHRAAEELQRLVEQRTLEAREANHRLETTNERLVRLMSRDEVTAVANRRIFDEHLATALDEAAHEGRALSLIIVEVEDFGAYRNQQGRRRADVCLRQIADVLRQGVRESEIVARIESDQFAIVLNGTGLIEAQAIATKLRLAVDALQIAYDGRFVTITAGAAEGLPGNDAGAFIARADTARHETAQPPQMPRVAFSR
jgi:diguanylate cyclase (GGDEF)-like protein